MTGHSIEERIAASPFFAGLAPEFIRFLASRAAARSLAAGEMLFGLIGAGVSGLLSAIAGSAFPNSRLGEFEDEIEAGKLLSWSTRRTIKCRSSSAS